MIRNLIIAFIVVLLSINLTGAVKVIPAPVEKWTCYDYSINYAKENPDWGVVTISDNQLFRGTAHMVNYKLLSDGRLSIHDGLLEADYTIAGWQYGDYYHFWLNGCTPLRNYRIVQDNSKEFLESNTQTP